MTAAVVRPLRGSRSRRAALVRSILEALPAWFGIRSARDAYVVIAARERSFVAEADGTPVGFLTLKRHTSVAWEVAVMAVRPEHRRRGIGRFLIHAAEAYAHGRGAHYLTVKTLAPSARHTGFARTRAFYRAMGFEPIEVFPTLWSRENPCQLMVKNVGRRRFAIEAALIRSRQKPHTSRAEDLIREDRDR
ncbi:MAG: GNAT family N-acetyltransferase [Alphaproteobacteria bacterium]